MANNSIFLPNFDRPQGQDTQLSTPDDLPKPALSPADEALRTSMIEQRAFSQEDNLEKGRLLFNKFMEYDKILAGIDAEGGPEMDKDIKRREASLAFQEGLPWAYEYLQNNWVKDKQFLRGYHAEDAPIAEAKIQARLAKHFYGYISPEDAKSRETGGLKDFWRPVREYPGLPSGSLNTALHRARALGMLPSMKAQLREAERKKVLKQHGSYAATIRQATGVPLSEELRSLTAWEEQQEIVTALRPFQYRQLWESTPEAERKYMKKPVSAFDAALDRMSAEGELMREAQEWIALQDQQAKTQFGKPIEELWRPDENGRFDRWGALQFQEHRPQYYAWKRLREKPLGTSAEKRKDGNIFERTQKGSVTPEIKQWLATQVEAALTTISEETQQKMLKYFGKRFPDHTRRSWKVEGTLFGLPIGVPGEVKEFAEAFWGLEPIFEIKIRLGSKGVPFIQMEPSTSSPVRKMSHGIAGALSLMYGPQKFGMAAGRGLMMKTVAKGMMRKATDMLKTKAGRKLAATKGISASLQRLIYDVAGRSVASGAGFAFASLISSAQAKYAYGFDVTGMDAAQSFLSSALFGSLLGPFGGAGKFVLSKTFLGNPGRYLRGLTSKGGINWGKKIPDLNAMAEETFSFGGASTIMAWLHGVREDKLKEEIWVALAMGGMFGAMRKFEAYGVDKQGKPFTKNTMLEWARDVVGQTMIDRMAEANLAGIAEAQRQIRDLLPEEILNIQTMVREQVARLGWGEGAFELFATIYSAQKYGDPLPSQEQLAKVMRTKKYMARGGANWRTVEKELSDLTTVEVFEILKMMQDAVTATPGRDAGGRPAQRRITTEDITLAKKGGPYDKYGRPLRTYNANISEDGEGITVGNRTYALALRDRLEDTIVRSNLVEMLKANGMSPKEAEAFIENAQIRVEEFIFRAGEERPVSPEDALTARQMPGKMGPSRMLPSPDTARKSRTRAASHTPAPPPSQRNDDRTRWSIQDRTRPEKNKHGGLKTTKEQDQFIDDIFNKPEDPELPGLRSVVDNDGVSTRALLRLANDPEGPLQLATRVNSLRVLNEQQLKQMYNWILEDVSAYMNKHVKPFTRKGAPESEEATEAPDKPPKMTEEQKADKAAIRRANQLRTSLSDRTDAKPAQLLQKLFIQPLTELFAAIDVKPTPGLLVRIANDRNGPLKGTVDLQRFQSLNENQINIIVEWIQKSALTTRGKVSPQKLKRLLGITRAKGPSLPKREVTGKKVTGKKNQVTFKKKKGPADTKKPVSQPGQVPAEDVVGDALAGVQATALEWRNAQGKVVAPGTPGAMPVVKAGQPRMGEGEGVPVEDLLAESSVTPKPVPRGLKKGETWTDQFGNKWVVIDKHGNLVRASEANLKAATLTHNRAKSETRKATSNTRVAHSKVRTADTNDKVAKKNAKKPNAKKKVRAKPTLTKKQLDAARRLARKREREEAKARREEAEAEANLAAARNRLRSIRRLRLPERGPRRRKSGI